MLDAALKAALKNAEEQPDAEGAIAFLAVTDGLQSVLTRCTWDGEAVFSTMVVLGKIPKGATGKLVLRYFFAHQPWRDCFCECAHQLHQLLPRRPVEHQRVLALGWVQLSLLAVEEHMVMDKYTGEHMLLPLTELQMSVGSLVARSRQSTFDDATRRTLQEHLAQLSAAHHNQSRRSTSPFDGLGGLSSMGGFAAGGLDTSASSQVPWTRARLLPAVHELDPARCLDPRPNLTKGQYGSLSEYLSTHFHLLRED
jgi:hypothetical protein